ncbi:signal peptide peptidase SppA [Candidatus Poribacteria bacterium]|nr:signal peptide peptidase SppA [Candidatus Poribacteria bacterium]MYK16661.1 signal peptide peptidase SppA [Candidatus Poribacteria bacterium]
MKKRRVFIVLGIIVALFFLILILRSMSGGTSIGQKVAVIDITGIITKSDATIKLIHTYRDDSSIKAIVIRIDTPGGSVAPVQEIYSELQKIEKPIVASMGGTAASGGYYVACAADTIMANPGTLTGSIGVIMQFTRMKGLYDKIGLEHQVIKSGEFKDTGSPFRTLTEEEQAVLQATVDNVYNQFVDTIFEARKSLLSRSEIAELADGRIFSGQQALDLKLLDRLGNLPEAIELAGELANIDGKPKVVRKEKKTSLLEQLLGVQQTPILDEMFSLPGVTFRYQMSLGD